MIPTFYDTTRNYHGRFLVKMQVTDSNRDSTLLLNATSDTTTPLSMFPWPVQPVRSLVRVTSVAGHHQLGVHAAVLVRVLVPAVQQRRQLPLRPPLRHRHVLRVCVGAARLPAQQRTWWPAGETRQTASSRTRPALIQLI